MKEQSRVENNEVVFLGEEDYIDNMINIVRPILEGCWEKGCFQSEDGITLYYENYIHPEEKAAVVISHGFCEFTAKFEEVIYYFLQAGYSVYSFDYRGHGKSSRVVKDPSKVYVESYEEYVNDLHSFITKIVYKNTLRRDLILYGHSMGGAIAALYLEQYPDIFRCAILSSPMLKMKLGKIPVTIIWILMLMKKLTRSDQDYVPGHKAFDGASKFERSSCLSEVRYNHIFTKRLEERNYQTYGATYSWTLASMKAVRKLQKHAGKVTTPTLILQAGNDTTVSNSGQDRFAEKSKYTSLVLIADSKHEIFNGDSRMREEYFKEIFSFLDTVFSS